MEERASGERDDVNRILGGKKVTFLIKTLCFELQKVGDN